MSAGLWSSAEARETDIPGVLVGRRWMASACSPRASRRGSLAVGVPARHVPPASSPATAAADDPARPEEGRQPEGVWKTTARDVDFAETVISNLSGRGPASRALPDFGVSPQGADACLKGAWRRVTGGCHVAACDRGARLADPIATSQPPFTRRSSPAALRIVSAANAAPRAFSTTSAALIPVTLEPGAGEATYSLERRRNRRVDSRGSGIAPGRQGRRAGDHQRPWSA